MKPYSLGRLSASDSQYTEIVVASKHSQKAKSGLFGAEIHDMGMKASRGHPELFTRSQG